MNGSRQPYDMAWVLWFIAVKHPPLHTPDGSRPEPDTPANLISSQRNSTRAACSSRPQDAPHTHWCCRCWCCPRRVRTQKRWARSGFRCFSIPQLKCSPKAPTTTTSLQRQARPTSFDPSVRHLSTPLDSHWCWPASTNGKSGLGKAFSAAVPMNTRAGSGNPRFGRYFPPGRYARYQQPAFNP